MKAPRRSAGLPTAPPGVALPAQGKSSCLGSAVCARNGLVVGGTTVGRARLEGAEGPVMWVGVCCCLEGAELWQCLCSLGSPRPG